MDKREVKALRAELGWTQHQMGAAMNASQPVIWKWENGVAVPDVYRAAALTQLRARLDEAKVDRQKQEFIEGLKVAGAVGAVALLAYLFSR